MILDEPTASLDPMAEQEIFNQFDRLRNNKTTVFVSHRLSSATIADQIIVIENGCLIEKGSHRELMDRQGKYFDLFTTQSKRYVSEGDTPPSDRRPPRRPISDQSIHLPHNQKRYDKKPSCHSVFLCSYGLAKVRPCLERWLNLRRIVTFCKKL
jgi:ABC-type multidrug transport system ATPase subunit